MRKVSIGSIHFYCSLNVLIASANGAAVVIIFLLTVDTFSFFYYYNIVICVWDFRLELRVENSDRVTRRLEYYNNNVCEIRHHRVGHIARNICTTMHGKLIN